MEDARAHLAQAFGQPSQFPGGSAAARSALFSAADIGAIAHLYRGELYRGTI